MNISRIVKSNLRTWRVSAGAVLPLAGCTLVICTLAICILSGCNRASQIATEVIAGKDVAQKMAQSEGARDKTAKAAQAEATRQNNDARVALGQHLYTSWMEFRAQPSPPQAGQNAVWTMNIWQAGKIAKNNNWIEEFKYVHEKLLHVVVVSKDLSYFNHIYPDFRGDGLFITSQTLPHAGDFKLFADYTLTRGVQEVAQHEFKVVAPKHIADYLVAEPSTDVATSGWINKRVFAKPDGEPDAPNGELYNVALKSTPLIVDKMAMMHFRISDARNDLVTDLQPFLGAAGYAIIVSGDTKIYLNAEAIEEENSTSSTRNTPENDAQATFQTVFPAPGIYKIWAQFQHKNRVITAPFVVRVADKTRTTSLKKQP